MSGRRAGVTTVLVLAVPLIGGLAGCRDDEGDVEAFCEAVETLQLDDPFADLAIASPGEMRAAFEHLAAGVDRIAATAPPEARTQAQAYQDAVDELIDQLRGAGFDPRNVDPQDYRRAVADHDTAARSVENAAGSICR